MVRRPPRSVVFLIFVALAIAGLILEDVASVHAASSNNAFTPATGENGMVSSAHPLATEAGLEILTSGGNAFDAAVAVAASLNVVEPQNSGIGGYGIILIYDAGENRVRVLNSSGRFPEAVDSDVFRKPNPNYLANRASAKAISTPTNLNAWEALSKEYGTLPWERLFDEAIRLAREGHPINGSVANAIHSAFERMSDYTRTFYSLDGEPLEEGDVLVQRDLQKTLELIAEKGASVLYGGAVGKDLIATAEKYGSFLRMSDLVKNEAEWWDPISIDYRGYTVYTASPPGNSFSSLMRLGMMENFDVKALGHNSVGYLHRFGEVTKHAYWARLKYAGDPDVAPPPLNMLLSDTYLAKKAGAINLEQAQEFVPPGVSGATGQHTTHFVTADRWGNIVSATQTIGSGFGSKVMVEGRGIWLNNSMYFCTFEPKGNPMDAHAGRRKLNSNHPTIIFHERKPRIAIGTPGGHTIGQTVPQMIMNMIDFGMDIQRAIAAPRVSFVEPNTLRMEERIPEYIRDQLAGRKHNIGTTSSIGNGHGLTIDYDDDGRPSNFTGGADPRGRGQAKGY